MIPKGCLAVGADWAPPHLFHRPTLLGGARETEGRQETAQDADPLGFS